MLFEDENTTTGMLRILNHIHGYLASAGEGEEAIFKHQGVIGDQLTVERAVNAIAGVENAYTPAERLEGLHIGIADWHTDMKFLEV